MGQEARSVIEEALSTLKVEARAGSSLVQWTAKGRSW